MSLNQQRPIQKPLKPTIAVYKDQANSISFQEQGTISYGG